MPRLLWVGALCALVVGGCTQTRQDIAEGIAFVQQANTLSNRPDATGNFPSPFQDAAPAGAPNLLTQDAKATALADLERRGAGTTAEVRATETRLGAISPY